MLFRSRAAATVARHGDEEHDRRVRNRAQLVLVQDTRAEVGYELDEKLTSSRWPREGTRGQGEGARDQVELFRVAVREGDPRRSERCAVTRAEDSTRLSERSKKANI